MNESDTTTWENDWTVFKSKTSGMFLMGCQGCDFVTSEMDEAYTHECLGKSWYGDIN